MNSTLVWLNPVFAEAIFCPRYNIAKLFKLFKPCHVGIICKLSLSTEELKVELQYCIVVYVYLQSPRGHEKIRYKYINIKCTKYSNRKVKIQIMRGKSSTPYKLNSNNKLRLVSNFIQKLISVNVKSVFVRRVSHG